MENTINTIDEQVPVYDLDAVAQIAQQHQDRILAIQNEVCQDYNNLDNPVPFIVTVSAS